MKKQYKVYYGKDLKKPMIRLNNNLLSDFGFNVGDNISVDYNQNKIEIIREVK